MSLKFRAFSISKNIKRASLVQILQQFFWIGGFFLAGCAPGFFHIFPWPTSEISLTTQKEISMDWSRPITLCAICTWALWVLFSLIKSPRGGIETGSERSDGVKAKKQKRSPPLPAQWMKNLLTKQKLWNWIRLDCQLFSSKFVCKNKV